jgi:hypothetical protein
MIDRAHIGRVWPPFVTEVEKGRLRLLAKAIGETRPVHTDEVAAHAAGHRSILGPPTLPYCLLADSPVAQGYVADVGIPMARMLHGEVRLEYFADICAGDRVRVTRRLVGIEEKRGGTLELVRFECELHDDADGRLLARVHQVMVVRNP